jgi:hypothetical protein
MTQKEFDTEFKIMMIHEAALDERLVKICTEVVIGNTALQEDIDKPAQLCAEVAEYYNLNPDELDRSITLCEDNIMEEQWYV